MPILPRLWIMLRGGFGSRERADLARVKPYCVDQRRFGLQEANPVEILNHRGAIEHLASYNLQARFLNMSDDGQVVIVCETAAGANEVLRAALRRRHRHKDGYARRAWMSDSNQVFVQIQEVRL
jgi:hypothetical protein